jgi:hypothetical protein
LIVPVPWPPVSAPQVFHVIAVTVTDRVAHPTVSTVGRTIGVGAGPQDRTAGTEFVVVVLVGPDEVVDAGTRLVDAP